jgi:hypothetical protein
LQDKEVHDLVEHRQWACLRRAHALQARFGELVGRLLGVDFERFDAFSEHIDLLIDPLQICLESALQNFECGLLLQLLFL